MGNSSRHSDKLHVVVHYCGSSGNASYFDDLKSFLEEQRFSDRIKIVGKRDRFSTGRFEVTLKETKATIHSKKAGMGWPTTQQKKQAICVKICEALLGWDKRRGLSQMTIWRNDKVSVRGSYLLTMPIRSSFVDQDQSDT